MFIFLLTLGIALYGLSKDKDVKSLESESNNIKPPTIINVQNNATSNTAQSQSSNVSGFIHHEPDESFKFVKQGNTGSYDF